MDKKRIIFSKAVLVLIITFSVSVLFAQPGGGGGGTGAGGSPPAGTGGPVDGGAILLLAGVAGYAHMKLKTKKAN